MKNRVGRVLASLLLSVLTLGSALDAQHTERVIKANIPFDFVVGNEIFPAGRYSVVIIVGPVLLELHDSRAASLANVLTQSVQDAGQSGPAPTAIRQRRWSARPHPGLASRVTRVASKSCAQNRPFLLSESARDASKPPRWAIRARHLTITITKVRVSMNTGMNGSNGQSRAADLHVQEVIRSAERELHELLAQRAELMKRIGTIKQTLAGLANIFGDCVLSDQLLTFLDRKSASRQPGFTRACRVILMDAKKPLGARLVCQALQQRFPELLERHKDPMASVTTVLNRLADYTEARCSLDSNGRRVWEWIVEPENSADLLLAAGSSRFPSQPKAMSS